jgi:hypothetical protein
MKITRLIYIFLSLFLGNVALASECGNPVTIDSVNKLSAVVTLGDLTTKFGAWCQGDGPVSWYKSAQGKQIWFYWKKTTPAAAAGSKSNPVLMVTEVNADDEDEQKIIWPKEYVGQEMTVILLNEYGPQNK